MQYLRYNTDSQEVVFGIFVDSTDGNTEETGLTIANTDIKIWKAGATTLANKNSGGATHISNGIYYAVFDATDTNTLGSGKAYVHVSGALYQVLEFCVLPQKVYDSMIAGSDNLEVDTIQIEGADATDQINSACDTAINDAGVTTTRMGYVDYLANATYGLSAIETLVDELESRLTAQRASNLDELGTANIPADIDTLLSRLSAIRAGYIDNLSAGMVATSTEISALHDITVSDILAAETESGLTLAHAIQLMTSVLALKASGGGTTTVTFRNYGDTKNRITMTVDENGNRSDVVVSLD